VLRLILSKPQKKKKKKSKAMANKSPLELAKD